MVLPQNVMGFITADSPTFEEIGSMLGMAATDIWPNGYTLQQWKVVRSMNFSRVAGRELSMIELCQDFYAGMVLGFGPHHQPALPCGLLIWKAEDGKIHVGLHNPQFLLGLFFSDVQLGDDPVSQRSGQLFQSFPTIVFNELRGVVEHTLANFMTGPVSEFESARAVVDGWLSSNTGKTIASSQVKTDIVDQWDTAQEMYQIVSLEKAKQYRTGHVPHAINISFRTLLDNLATLDPSREIITYDATGNIGQISSTILSLMGFPSRNMKFGMMDWNLKDMRRDIGKKQWDGVANY
jgi:rhodanese-related sulfurtransferase